MTRDLGEIAKAWLQDRPYGGFNLMMVDPPWKFENYGEPGKKSPEAHYTCEDIEWVRGLPVGDLAGPNCLLLLWATGPMVPQQLTCLNAWGFQYCTMAWWSKKTVHGKQSFGQGHVLRNAGEPILVGKRGRVKTTRSTRNTWEGLARGHSRKPEEAYAAAHALMPEGREGEGFMTPIRADVFARQRRPGWTAFGNEIDKFAAA
ncbi:MT-A70 family methyltransferase [Sagittula salina]|uniref:DNA methyltransferase n=1 Tax=Sagittula salina TaxID=2820268 RepID=A0A940S505_9RHOB|nr:MT-A70 family methyltransferase [Sagittula salina]MBP0484654.1 DNA methyltransferase [Sagittula salina]